MKHWLLKSRVWCCAYRKRSERKKVLIKNPFIIRTVKAKSEGGSIFPVSAASYIVFSIRLVSIVWNISIKVRRRDFLHFYFFHEVINRLHGKESEKISNCSYTISALLKRAMQHATLCSLSLLFLYGIKGNICLRTIS